MTKKKILFLLGTYPSYGGVEMTTTVLANQFIKDGHDVFIVSFSQPDLKFADLYLSHKCNLLYLSYPVLSIQNIKCLSRYIKKNNINILINQWVLPFYTTLLWRFAIFGNQCKIYSVHHNKPNTNKKIQELDILIQNGKNYLKPIKWIIQEVSRLSLSFCIKSSTKYILLSSSFIPIAKRYTRIQDDRKYMAITNPITIPEPLKLPEKKKEIICVGRIEFNQKRTYRVLKIWKDLESSFPEWSLTFVGDGPDKKKLEKQIKENKLSRVSIAGFVNPIQYYERASILLMTSEYEGFPLVLTESMTYGVVPIVYDSFEAVHDIITNKKNGIIIPSPYKTEAFVNYLNSFLKDNNKIKEMSIKAIESTNRFKLKNIVDKW